MCFETESPKVTAQPVDSMMIFPINSFRKKRRPFACDRKFSQPEKNFPKSENTNKAKPKHNTPVACCTGRAEAPRINFEIYVGQPICKYE